MTTRIHWTDNERNAVLSKALELHQKGSAISHFEALRTAQTYVLSKERQRAFATHSSATAELKHLRARAKYYTHSMAPEVPPQQEVVTPTVVNPVPPAPPEPPQPSTLDAMIEAIAAKIAATLVQAVKREVKELEHTFKLEKHNPTYEASGIHKPHVTVIGLLPEQEQHIQREFGDKFVLRFLGNEAARHAYIPMAAAYLLMKSFISHAVYDRYKTYPQHVLVDGGMTALRMWFNTKGAEL